METSTMTGNMAMLILSILSEKDMYGYEMMEVLNKRSDGVFSLKAGTLYPLLHGLEEQGYIVSYDGEITRTRIRKYYRLTHQGALALQDKKAQWSAYSSLINRVIGETP